MQTLTFEAIERFNESQLYDFIADICRGEEPVRFILNWQSLPTVADPHEKSAIAWAASGWEAQSDDWLWSPRFCSHCCRKDIGFLSSLHKCHHFKKLPQIMGMFETIIISIIVFLATLCK